MVITFKGFPPHDLGPVEIAVAKSVNGHVELTLHVLDDWHSPSSIPVQVKMAPTVARSLAQRLTAAAEEAEPTERR